MSLHLHFSLFDFFGMVINPLKLLVEQIFQIETGD